MVAFTCIHPNLKEFLKKLVGENEKKKEAIETYEKKWENGLFITIVILLHKKSGVEHNLQYRHVGGCVLI